MFLAKLQKVAFGVAAAAGVGLALWGVAVLAAPAPIPEPPAKAAEAAPVDVSLVPVDLLQDRKVLRELKTTADQRDAIADALEAAEDEGEKLLKRALQDPEKLPNDGDRDTLYRQIAALMEGASQKAIREALDRRQQARLVQVALQVAGPEVFQEAAVVKGLQLTAEQRKKVAETILKAEEAVAKLSDKEAPDAPLDPDAYNPEALQKFYDDAKKEIVENLTKEQQEAWKAMTGNPINFVPRPRYGIFTDPWRRA